MCKRTVSTSVLCYRLSFAIPGCDVHQWLYARSDFSHAANRAGSLLYAASAVLPHHEKQFQRLMTKFWQSSTLDECHVRPFEATLRDCRFASDNVLCSVSLALVEYRQLTLFSDPQLVK